MRSDPAAPLLEISDLSIQYGRFVAVDGVNLAVGEGETVGLVGESGCGKSTLARCIMRLVVPVSGRILFRGEDILAYDRKRLRKLRSEIQMIFQDPFSSLDPRFRVHDIIGEPLKFAGVKRKERYERVSELASQVGLRISQLDRYPHEFSGGQRQRVGIARALALNPSLIVCDEPVSALDVSIQAQVLNLLMDLRERYRMAYLFISHDLGVVRALANRIAVMYGGRIVEYGQADAVFSKPSHPYTQVLLAASSLPELDHSKLTMPSPEHLEAVLADRSAPLSEVAPGHFCRMPSFA